MFPVRQLISDPFLRTDFDQVGKKKTEDGEKGKERGGFSFKNCWLPIYLCCPSSVHVSGMASPLYVPFWPRLDAISLFYYKKRWQGQWFPWKGLDWDCFWDGRERRETRWQQLFHSIFIGGVFHFSGPQGQNTVHLEKFLRTQPMDWIAVGVCRLQSWCQPDGPSVLLVILIHFNRMLNYTYLHYNTAVEGFFRNCSNFLRKYEPRSWISLPTVQCPISTLWGFRGARGQVWYLTGDLDSTWENTLLSGFISKIST